MRAVAAVVALCVLAGCASHPQADAPDQPSVDLVAPEVIAAARSTIDRINTTAGGPVDAQRAVLEQVVAASEAESQARCPQARTTLAFDPAYRELRPAPGGTRDEYLLPTYITIFDGARTSGSDITTIRLWIDHGTARTAALCVS